MLFSSLPPIFYFICEGAKEGGGTALLARKQVHAIALSTFSSSENFHHLHINFISSLPTTPPFSLDTALASTISMNHTGRQKFDWVCVQLLSKCARCNCFFWNRIANPLCFIGETSPLWSTSEMLTQWRNLACFSKSFNPWNEASFKLGPGCFALCWYDTKDRCQVRKLSRNGSTSVSIA